MKKVVLPFLVLFCLSLISYGQTSNVTFSVDMSTYGGSTANGVFVNGTWNGWCGGCNALTDANSDGIWEGTFNIPDGQIEYKFTVDGWNDQENLTPGMLCVLTTGAFTNRVYTVAGDATLPTVCWNSCAACGAVTSSDVTFSVDMNTYGGSTANGVFVNGTWNSWCGNCNALSDGDNDGVWEGTFNIPHSTIEYKFTVDGWNDQESLTPGMPCVVTNSGFTNRVGTVTSATTLPTVCWNSCAGCSVSTSSDVTFSVDMSQYTGSTANGVFVNGTWNSWCGSCNPLSDDNADGIWEGTFNIPNGTIEYKFTVDGWNDQESLLPGMSCVVTAGGFTNRTDAISGDVTLPTVCWNSCAGCSVSTSSDVTFSVDMSQYTGSTANGVFVNGNWNGWCGSCNPLSDSNSDGVWEGTFNIPNGQIEYKFTVDGWNDQEALTPGMSCVLTTSGFTNRVYMVAGNATLPTVCWNSCSDCSVITSGNVTFSVDMSQYTGSTANGVFVNGTWNGWCGNCNALSDGDGDGVWEGTFNISNGTVEYKFTVDGWNDEENLTPGMSCVLTTGAFTNRVYTVAGDATLPTVCWNSCSACPVLPDSCRVIWTDMVDVHTSGYSLVKTGGLLGWRSGANSLNVLQAGQDGWASMEAMETNKMRVFGLSKFNTSQGKRITYSIFLNNDGTFSVLENNADKGNFGSYAMGDVFKIKRTGTTVEYLKNGVVFYTSTASSNTELYVDASLHTAGATIHNAYISFGCMEDPCTVFEVSVDNTTDETCVGANDGTATFSTNNANISYAWSDGYSSTSTMRSGMAAGSYAVVATDTLTGCSTTLSLVIASGDACYYPDSCLINWDNLVGVSVSGSTVTKMTGGTAWNASGLSMSSLSAGMDGWVEMEAIETNTRRIFGLAQWNNKSHQRFDYALYLNNNKVAVLENGSSKGTFGTYASGDKFRVVRTGSTVAYYHNGSLIYTSMTPSMGVLYADFSINAMGGTIHNAYASFGCDAIFTAPRIGNGASANTTANGERANALKEATIYPNPTSGSMTLNLTFDNDTDVNVAIIDLTGRVLETRQLGNTNAAQLNFDVSNFAEGIYFVRISTNNAVTTKRFVVIK